MASQTSPPEDDAAPSGAGLPEADAGLPPELVSVHDPAIDRPDDAVGRRLALLVGGLLPAQITTTFAQLSIAEELGEAGRTAGELAGALSLPERPLTRLLRAAGTFGLVRMDADGTFAATALSDRLRADVPGSLRDMVIGFMLPPTWDAVGRLPELVRTGEPADPQLMWDYVRAHPDAATRFAGAMGVQTAALTRYLRTAGYAPPPCQRIVDVGGSRGILLSYLLQVAPMARGVLLDRAEALTLAPSVLTQAGVEDRVEIVTGDFMTEVPDGDLHVLCHVLHDWDDEIALQIARNCFRASRPGGSLVVIEYLLPTPPEPSLSYLMDVLMMTVEAGGERTREDFQTLMGSAGYQFSREVPVTSPGRTLPQRVLEFRRV
ncbi:MAG TPA: methyltransferase [Streptosporangiaceae bacterium]